MGAESLPGHIGPYLIQGILGKGGMGVVYRALHGTTGQPAALKTVRIVRQSQVSGIRREIHALAGIRHPGVVRIVNSGVAGGIPWYAMELLEGRTLRDLTGEPGSGAPMPSTDTQAESPENLTTGPLPLKESDRPLPAASVPRQPLSLQDILTVARRICYPLAYIHGEGIVHRDLKPENIFIRLDGTPVLVDFGLISRFSTDSSRETLDPGGAVAGTVAYMSPEQIRGEYVDARSDIYSFGCILYELISGRKAFTGSSVLEVARAHLTFDPTPPSEFNPGISAGLDELVCRLIARKPGDRLGYMEDAARLLGELGAGDGLPGTWPKPKLYLYRPSLSGRQGEILQFRQWLEQLEKGAGQAVFIEGESGSGKTRLALEMIREARDADAAVVAAECQPAPETPEYSATSTGTEFQLMRKIIQHITDTCRESDPRETSLIFGPDIKILAPVEPSVLNLPGTTVLPDPVPLPPDDTKFRLFSYLSSVMEVFALRRPMFLALDDMQWIDELSAEFLGYFIRTKLRLRIPVLIVGFLRSGVEKLDLKPLLSGSHSKFLRLNRLEKPAVERMIGDMIALWPPPRSLTKFLQDFSEGNPFFVAEYMLSSMTAGILYRDEAGRWNVAQEDSESATEFVFESQPIPVAVRKMILQRTACLSEPAQTVLKAMSVIGRDAPPEIVERTSGLDDERLMPALTELIHRQIVVESPDGELHLSHHKFSEVHYAQIPDNQKMLLHRRTAAAMETVYSGSIPEHSALLGWHWQLAGEKEKACSYFESAARRATRNFTQREAERLYRQILNIQPYPTVEGIRTRVEFARDVLSFLGKNQEAEAMLLEASAQARKLNDSRGEAEALHSLAALYAEDIGRMSAARKNYEKSLGVYRRMGWRQREGEILGNLATIAAFEGSVDEALDYCRNAIDIHREQDQRPAEGKAVYQAAVVMLMHGRQAEAMQHFEDCIRIFRETGDQRYEALAIGKQVVLFEELGRLEDARAASSKALAIARSIRDRRLEALMLSDLGSIHDSMGERAEAQARFSEALAIFRDLENRRSEAICLAHIAAQYLAQNRLHEARKHAGESLVIFREIGDRRCEGLSLGDLAKIEMDLGNIETALNLFDEAIRITAEVHHEIQMPYLLRDKASLLRLGFGRMEEAGKLADEAVFLFDKHQNATGWISGMAEIAYCRMASGQPADDVLRRIDEKTDPSMQNGLAKDPADRLRSTMDVFRAGGDLIRGQRPEDVPGILRDKIVKNL